MSRLNVLILETASLMLVFVKKYINSVVNSYIMQFFFCAKSWSILLKSLQQFVRTELVPDHADFPTLDKLIDGLQVYHRSEPRNLFWERQTGASKTPAPRGLRGSGPVR